MADDPKKFWRLIETIVPGKKKKSGKISLVDRTKTGEAEREREVNDQEVADFINTFFSDIGPKLARNYTDPWEFFDTVVMEECPIWQANYFKDLQRD